MNKPKQTPVKMKKYEIHERFFHLTPLVTEPSLIELPEDEVIIGLEIVAGATSRFCIFSAKDVTPNAD
jgi:hypothetical protein